MIALNLETKNDSQKIIKAYLEENASQPFADKINNGVHIEKDGKTLINKKDLDGFWAYATKKAQELKSQYMDNDTVFCWAVHYFGEDDIEGTLYNEDGTEYKPTPKPVQRVPAPTVPIKPTPPKPAQTSLFDLLTSTSPVSDPAEEKIEKPIEEIKTPAPEDLDEDVDEPTDLEVDEETGEILSRKPAIQRKPTSLYQRYLDIQKQYPQAVVAYRLGDFFEIFGDNAIKIANLLELTLTGRDCGLDERIPMIGFPYHASDTYFKKISAFSQLIIVDGDSVSLYRTEEPPVTAKNEPLSPENNDDFKEERALQKFFDKDVLCALYELFDYNLDMQ